MALTLWRGTERLGELRPRASEPRHLSAVLVPAEGVEGLAGVMQTRLDIPPGRPVGRLFPGVHHRARFTVSLVSGDGRTRVSVEGRASGHLPGDSVFGSLAAASAFFEPGTLGYSAGRSPGVHDGLGLRTAAWQVTPLTVERVASSFFEDPRAFPPGSAAAPRPRADAARLAPRPERQATTLGGSVRPQPSDR